MPLSSSKRAIVTGGSRGIGLAIVNAFKAAGYDVTSFSRSEGVDLLDAKTRSNLMLDCDVLVNNAWTQQFQRGGILRLRHAGA